MMPMRVPTAIIAGRNSKDPTGMANLKLSRVFEELEIVRRDRLVLAASCFIGRQIALRTNLEECVFVTRRFEIRQARWSSAQQGFR